MRAVMGMIAMAAAVVCGGCIFVVENDHEDRASYYSSARGNLGVNLERVDAATASQLGLDRERVAMITRVYGGTPADRAGLRQYDIVTRVDGSDDASVERVRRAIRTHKDGEELKLTVLREGKPVEVAATIRG